MNKQDAENIQTVTQGCIRELNMLLKVQQGLIGESEFKDFKINVAKAMGALIHVEECSVYKDYPELRPYKLSSEK